MTNYLNIAAIPDVAHSDPGTSEPVQVKTLDENPVPMPEEVADSATNGMFWFIRTLAWC